jgi:hypothetical protein
MRQILLLRQRNRLGTIPVHIGLLDHAREMYERGRSSMLQRLSIGTEFACWPFFLKDPCLKNLRGLSEFETLVSSLQAKYPDHLGLL